MAVDTGLCRDVTVPVGNIAEFEITPAAACGQFAVEYWSGGRLVSGAGHHRQTGVVLRGDAHGQGWWTDARAGCSTLVRPEDLVSVVDAGPAPTPDEVAEMWKLIRAYRSPALRVESVRPAFVQGVLL